MATLSTATRVTGLFVGLSIMAMGCSGSTSVGEATPTGQPPSQTSPTEEMASAPDELASAADDGMASRRGSDEVPAMSLEVVDSVLIDFGQCLHDEGADVEPVSIKQMLGKLPDLPIDADRATTFAHFYDRDLSDPGVAVAIAACNHILDDPAIAPFIPSE